MCLVLEILNEVLLNKIPRICVGRKSVEGKIWAVVSKLASGAAVYHIWHHRNAIFSIAKG